MTVWLALRVGVRVEILGVFERESDAVAACTQRNDCIGPLALNEIAPELHSRWAGAYYPLAEKEQM